MTSGAYWFWQKYVLTSGQRALARLTTEHVGIGLLLASRGICGLCNGITKFDIKTVAVRLSGRI